MRHDTHRPSQIIPGDYTNVLFYNLPTSQEGLSVPSFGVNCELDRAERDQHGYIVKKGKHAVDGLCCLVGLRTIAEVKFADNGTTGQCTVCSTHFVYGEVWRHDPTGEHIHVGHICANKYNLLADYSEHELAYKRFRAARAREIQRRLKAEKVKEILSSVEGLEQALETPHEIVEDIKSRFHRVGRISEKQIALVFKLCRESFAPKRMKKKASVPVGRQTVQGRVVSTKLVESYYGSQLKMLVEVSTDDGFYRVFGTVPGSLYGFEIAGGDKTVEFTANFERSRDDESFGFFKRPSRARLV